MRRLALWTTAVMPGITCLAALTVPGPAAPPPCETAAGWRSVIESHVRRYPALELDDVYKLLHQGATGSEHAVESAGAARAWLDRELAALGDGPGEPLVDTIAPEGAHVRIHLRPFLESGGDAGALLDAFVATANAPAAPAGTLECALEAATQMAREGLLPWSAEEAATRFAALAAAGYPAIHHSPAFSARYRPAYRVVSGRLLAATLRR